MSESQHPADDTSDEPSFAEGIIFDANLREFATRVGLIVGLESGEKIPPGEAYTRIKQLWKQLKTSKKNLRIGEAADGDADAAGDSVSGA